ncbi:hypothetical protein Tco_0397796 [Tanacetum coccineum]
MEEYMIKTRKEYGSGIARRKFEKETNFSGKKGEDAVEHIKKVLKIIDLLDKPDDVHNRLRLGAFPISLTGVASKWLKDESYSSITTWVDLMKKFIGKYYPPSRTRRKIETSKISTKVEWDPTNVIFEDWLA